ncbi:ribokinase-like protein [Lophiotrema nucula]|uniref:Ribokinase n=1 Tax=Lophiotrema nucula TaxID=690887 RepID=A0A6A5ZSH3_9PLEO|nr:ribokinase-like protein [Lophiotrema nucula]
MAPPVIAVIGGLNMDLIFSAPRAPESGESLDATSLSTLPGGKGANTAVAIHRAGRARPHPTNTPDTAPISDDNGTNVYMNGTIGNDAFGALLKANLSSQGVSTSGIQTHSTEPTGTCAVFVEFLSNDSRNLGYQGANVYWTPPTPFSSRSLAGGNTPDLIVAHFGIPTATIEQALIAAHQEGVDTLLNPAPAYPISDGTYSSLTHLILNQTEASIIANLPVTHYKEAADVFVSKGVANVVVTLGSLGAYVATKEGVKGMVKAVPDVNVIDTTGAGDTFVGMYAAEYVRQKREGVWHLRTAVELACRAAAKSVGRLGAQEAMPWRDEIDS